MKPTLAIIALTASLAGLSSAAVVITVQSKNFTTGAPAALVFNQASPLWTLTQVNVSTTWSDSGAAYSATNTTSDPIITTFTYDASYRFGILSTIPADPFTPTTGGGPFLTFQSVTSPPIAVPGGGTGGFTQPVPFTYANAADAANPLAYQGPGTFTVLPLTNQSWSLSNQSFPAGTFTGASISGNVTVTYYYDVIPEPFSQPLLGALPLMALFYRSRRRS